MASIRSRVCLALSVLIQAVGCGSAAEQPQPSLTAARGDTYEDVQLPIGDVYNQYNTMWCWAFSAFHTLRTYYYNNQSDDGAIKAWRDSLRAVDTWQKFWDYLDDNFPSNQGDNPDHFIREAQADWHLPATKWTNYYPSDRASVREARNQGDTRFPTVHERRSKIIARMAANLRRGVPSVYCNPPHCMMIYGAKFNNDRVTHFSIADSSGGRTYDKSANAVFNDLDLVVTLPESVVD